MTEKILSNGNHPLSDEERQYRIDLSSKFYGQFLTAMGFDWENDPNMKDTPLRVSKAYINELFEGCFSEPPKITAFENTLGYDGIVFQGKIGIMLMVKNYNFSDIYIKSQKNAKTINLTRFNT